MDKNKLTFRITTVVLGLMYMGAATRYFVQYEELANTFAKLGYPGYLQPILGVTKYLAAIGLFMIAANKPALPKWLKEWTYAAIFLNASLAFLAHQMIHEPIGASMPAIMVLVLVFISRVYYGKVYNE